MNVRIDISNVCIKTKRIILRAFKETDIYDFYEYAKVDGVGEMAGWHHHESVEDSKEILDEFIKEKKTFAIEYKGKVIGSVGIENYNEELLPEFAHKKGREIGFVLSKDYWGQGLMPESVKAVLDYLLNEINVDFIICCHSVTNIQSKRVQEKCGFVPYKNINDKCINVLYPHY